MSPDARKQAAIGAESPCNCPNRPNRSVLFNFLGRDFFNALAEKNVDQFYTELWYYLGAFVVGIPVFVFKGYYQVGGHHLGL